MMSERGTALSPGGVDRHRQYVQTAAAAKRGDKDGSGQRRIGEGLQEIRRSAQEAASAADSPLQSYAGHSSEMRASMTKASATSKRMHALANVRLSELPDSASRKQKLSTTLEAAAASNHYDYHNLPSTVSFHRSHVFTGMKTSTTFSGTGSPRRSVAGGADLGATRASLPQSTLAAPDRTRWQRSSLNNAYKK